MKDTLVIQGLAGKKTLSGSVKIHGAKNAVLKAMAAAALFDGEVTLTNVPDTADVETISQILKKLGAKVERKVDKNNVETVTIDPRGITSTDMDVTLARSMRASVVLTGPLLARFGKVTFAPPGGDDIGARPIDIFVSGYESMKATVSFDEKARIYSIVAHEGLKPTDITFRKISVGATETLMMAAVLGSGTTILRNCAREPEIQSEAEWLNACGAKISGIGTETMTIQGTDGKLLQPKVPYVSVPDRIETGSFLVLGALAASDLTITNCEPKHIDGLIQLLQKSGVPIEIGANTITISHNTSPNNSFKAFDVTTKEYPGFATDLQPIVATYLTQVAGTSTLTETIYEGRFKYITDLINLGAHITKVNDQQISVVGPVDFSSPKSRELTTYDIRAGFALVLAALLGTGEFTVSNVHLIDRGYERLEEQLSSLRANVHRT